MDTGTGTDQIMFRITGHPDILSRLSKAVERAVFEELGEINLERVRDMPETMKKGGCAGCPQVG